MKNLNKKKLIIRADSTSQIGTGHIMRCIALGQAWQDNGGKVVFVSKCESEFLSRRITAEGFEFITLKKTHPDPFDSEFTVKTIKTKGAELGSWIVLDGYHFDSNYQKVFRAAGFNLLIIDDMGQWPQYFADVILNQNPGVEKTKYVCSADTALLLGPRYSLLRREFISVNNRDRKIPKVALKVLVTMGGADADNVTQKVIDAIPQIEIEGLEAVVVVGNSNPHLHELQEAVDRTKAHIRLVNNANMPELMKWADVALTAGGSTCLELAFMGLPSLMIVLADNQEPMAIELEKYGSAINLGWHNTVKSQDIAAKLHSLMISPEKRDSMSNRGRQLVDGCGSKRVVRQLCGCELTLRPVQAEDCRLIWEWANDSVVREMSFTTEKIPWEKHIAWFESKLKDSSVYFYIVIDNDKVPAGQIRFDINQQEAVVSISIAPSKRGEGYSSEIIRIGVKKILEAAGVDIIHAYIKEENIASVRAFTKVGFIKSGMTEVHGSQALHYVLKRTQVHE